MSRLVRHVKTEKNGTERKLQVMFKNVHVVIYCVCSNFCRYVHIRQVFSIYIHQSQMNNLSVICNVFQISIVYLLKTHRNTARQNMSNHLYNNFVIKSFSSYNLWIQKIWKSWKSENNTSSGMQDTLTDILSWTVEKHINI